MNDISAIADNRTSLATVTIYEDHLQHNLDQFAGEHELAPVLKSNAYGHGLELVADAINEREDVPFVCLAAIRELQQLRATGHTVPALIMGHTPAAVINDCQLDDAIFSISSYRQLKGLDNCLTNRRNFHLKVETGMHRYGIKPDQLPAAIEIIEDNPRIVLTGAFSHFADAYEPASEFTRTQIDRWNRAAEKITQKLDTEYLHMAATSGNFYRQELTANVERVGIGMYGVTDYASDLDLQPALSLKSFVAGVKQVSADSSVGYNQSYTADKDITIATLPIGYFEGVDRRLSNTGAVKINDHICPIIGKVSMNATMVDISSAEAVQPGDPAEIISADANQPNSVLNIADTADTIPYDILVHIPAELTREAV